MTSEREFSPWETREEDCEEEVEDDSELEEHARTCEADDCLCRTPSGEPYRGNIAKAGDSTGIVLGKARDGLYSVKWGDFWVQGYPREQFILSGDHWEVVCA